MHVDPAQPQPVPLIDPRPTAPKAVPPVSDTSLLAQSPEEIQRNLEQWRQQQARLHVVA